MKVKLIKDARIWHKAGETVDVSPAEYQYLVSVGSAVDVPAKAKKAIETPEDNAEETPKKRNKK